MLNDLIERDRFDSSREHAPLTAADGAIRVNTDGLTIPQVVDRLEGIVGSAWAEMNLSLDAAQ